MDPTRPPAAAIATASMPEFLGVDFARLGEALMKRCAAIHGKRLYLSGATGFFGKNLLSLLAYLHGRGVAFEVTALSRDPQRFLRAHPGCAGYSWLQWQQGDARRPWPGTGRYDLLLHAATDTVASAHVDTLEVFEGVVAASRAALNFASRRGVERLLLCGSGAQYGTRGAQAGAVAESSMVACDSASGPSAYGEAKRVSELLAALQAQTRELAVINTRCFAFVGPGLALDGHFAIGNFIRDTLAGRPLVLKSSGTTVRSYLYSADLAVWLLLLLLEPKGGTTVNVGSDQPIRVVDLAMRVRDLLNPGLEVQVGHSDAAEQRPFYLPSIERARALGLEDWTPLDQAILRTAQWYRQMQP